MKTNDDLNLLSVTSIFIVGLVFINSNYTINYAYSQTEQITIDIDETQFIPIGEATNNLDVLVNYTINDLSLSGSQINGIMEIFSSDGTQIKTVSFSEGFTIGEEGTIFMSTKFTDEPLSSLTVNVTLTDLHKTKPISNTDTTTVPYDDEEGQERLKDKFDREVEERLEREQNEDDNREIERIESSSQSDLKITSATSYFERDNFYIVGEVLNSASDEKEFVEVVATLYDEDGDVIGTQNTFTNPSTISSQDSSPFRLIVDENDVSNLDDINSYKIIASDG